MKRPNSKKDWESRWEDSADSFEDQEPHEEDSPEEYVCWRCEKRVLPVAGRCPFCRAKLESRLEERIVLPAHRHGHILFKVIWAWVGLMAISLVLGLILFFQNREGFIPRDTLERRALTGTFIAEGVSILLVLGSWAWIGFPPPLSRPKPPMRLLAWIWGLPVLAMVLAVNFGYHWLLNRYVQGPRIDFFPLTPVWLLLICVQPAVVEEFFFRYLAFNGLRQYLGVQGTVWVSATMFGMAHIGAPLSIPLLVLLGAVLAYARLASGGLLLPMLMHFGHNLAVLYLHSLP